VAEIEKNSGIQIDLVLVNGDFEAMRNESDLNSLACPPKYRHMGSFVEYYTKKRKAPYLTIIVGGNHESSNYLSELHYGGWLAENIYYLGKCGVVKVKNFRIGGISGIFKGPSYRKGYYENFPLDDSDMRSIYHVREYEILKFSLIEKPLDIMMTHDWPNNITDFGDVAKLLKFKPHFEEEINQGTLGSPPSQFLLEKLKPALWLSAHLHTYFEAHVTHPNTTKTTQFLALGKPTPKSVWYKPLSLIKNADGSVKIEQIKFDSKISGPDSVNEMKKEIEPIKILERKIPEIHLDIEWVSIIRATDELMSLKIHADYYTFLQGFKNYVKYCPFKGKPMQCEVNYKELSEMAKKEEEAFLKYTKNENIKVPDYDVKKSDKEYNPQTNQLLSIIGIKSKLYPDLKGDPIKYLKAEQEIDVLEFL